MKATEVTPRLEPWDREPDPCWSCGGEAEARDDIHVRCIDSKNIDCEVMNKWFTRKTWNTRVNDSLRAERDRLKAALEKISKCIGHINHKGDYHPDCVYCIAAAALKGE